LTQTKPVIKAEGGKARVNVFGMFVKDNFAEVRRVNPGVAHKEVMGILSRMYKEQKETGTGKGGKGLSEEGKPVNERTVIEIEDDEVAELGRTLEDVVL